MREDKLATGKRLHRLARVGILVVLALLRGASITDVGNEHVGKRLVVGLAATSTSERDGGAVHVKLAVANLVEPGPGDRAIPSRDIGRDREAIVKRHLEVRVVAQVARRIPRRAATFNGVDDLPDAVLGGRIVVRDGYLAGASTVDSGADKGEGLCRAQGHRVHLADLVDAIA